MSEKVKLPKQVCDALNYAMTLSRNFDFTIAEMTHHGKWELKELEILNTQNSDLIMRALVLGYEPELSAEEQLKERYLSNYYSNSYKNGMQETLKVLRIQYDWLGDLE